MRTMVNAMKLRAKNQQSDKTKIQKLSTVMELVDSTPKPETIDVEVDAETSTNEKPLSKGARKRRNKRIKNQQPEEGKPSMQHGNNDDAIGKTKKKLSNEEKNQRKKLFIEKNEEKNIIQALRKQRGPTFNLPEFNFESAKPFSSESRLYVGNIPKALTMKNIEELFTPFGQVSDIFVNYSTDKPYILLRMDTLENAERARRNLNRSIYHNKRIFVHMSRKFSAIRVQNLNASVTNELLKKGFEVFGEVERVVVHMTRNDESAGDGIVQFANHSSAQAAIRYCSEECFFLTASLQPVICEPYNALENKIGFTEQDIDQNTQFYLHERSIGPRFAENSVQHEYGNQYKQLFAAYEYKKNQLDEEFKQSLFSLHREIKLVQLREALFDSERVGTKAHQRKPKWNKQKKGSQ